MCIRDSFRSESGLYKAMNEYGYSPEHMLSHTFFMRHTEMFFDYYKKNLIYPDAEPNKAHRALAELEQAGKLTGIVTQNIDGLHQKAGSRKVYELHGSVMRNSCMDCGEHYNLDYIMNEDNCETVSYTHLDVYKRQVPGTQHRGAAVHNPFRAKSNSRKISQYRVYVPGLCDRCRTHTA